ncbi:metal-dependent phosphohydrolase [Geotalea daltonii FRC-32]|uniref:Metal-dependent phosphohydrolase n=1 Tax=Geotalea daltonii (strain DSM 22248 / JCM 15807 / FRC-32) TaxID=316067 RepID=B9M8H4_GEODF|nr:HD domain-containing protein [Geotalea daltonii]ACM18509.1 metal-dependent phosphohydrolase [Geotalea daltonii FRC-32]
MVKLPIYEKIYALAKPYLNTRKNDIHVEISHGFAWRLLEDEPGDPEVVIPAILCHDLGWIKLTEELQLKAFGPGFDPDLRRIHEVEGVKLARGILSRLDYNPQKTIEILHIIDGHDSRIQAISDSDKIVKDADKLFRCTATGLAIDMERFRQEKGPYRQWITSQIDSWFFTETGTRLAWAELKLAGFSP